GTMRASNEAASPLSTCRAVAAAGLWAVRDGVSSWSIGHRPVTTILAAQRNRQRLRFAMRTSIGARANLELIEENYRRWQRNPESVNSGWSAFFEGFELGNLTQRDGATVAEAEAREAALQTRVDGLIYAYCSL